MASSAIPAVVGIRREDKNKWERRAPLSPEAVAILVREHGIRVLVQPSNIRVYPDAAYLEAGAEIAEDLSPASTILAVKEVPQHLLLPNRTYAFFSHTIKGQANNMPLLDALLEKQIRLVDYEAITVGGLRGGKRLVAFGEFAGIAGMIDFLRGMGERYLGLGYSSPFLNIAATYSYPTLDAAYAAVRTCGESIARYGLPAALCPLTFVVTGDGNVSKGAQKVLNCLPCIKWVSPSELRGIVEAGADAPGARHTVFAAIAKEEHMVARRPASPVPSPVPQLALQSTAGAAAHTRGDSVFSIADEADEQAGRTPTAGSASGSPSVSTLLHTSSVAQKFDKAHYRAHPEAYVPVFHANVLPYTSVLVNAMFWAPQFPRLVTIAQAQDAVRRGTLRLMGVCDITCDFQGSVEFLKEFTSIERPFYVWDVAKDEVVHGSMEAPGVLYHAVDHLPSECPRDASDHFGSCLLPFLPALATSDASAPFEARSDLPEELRGAVICAHGALTPNFDYIAALRAANERAGASRSLRRARNESFVTLELGGHLFDSGIINRVLDLIEDADASAHILDFRVGKDRSTPTEMRVQLFFPPAHRTPRGRDGGEGNGRPNGRPGGADPASAMASLVRQIDDLASSVGVALQITSDGSGSAALSVPRPLTTGTKRVLVLGAGYVSAPLVEYLLRRPANFLTVASMVPSEAEALARGKPRVTPVALDVGSEHDKLASLVAAHDLVVSLVPAPCHPPVAKLAIAHRKHMVTASYVSPDMRALHEAAAAARIVIMNECGLDPGIDHMTAMAMIHDAEAAGGVVTGFSSLCGGLPAPEAANNPLGYKFSWSPRGALSAARNPARYLREGSVIEVPGDGLLASAKPVRVNPAFALEVLPNRDAMPYADKYGIAGPALRTMFRGTLRYAGFSGHMHSLAALGFLDPEARPLPQHSAASFGAGGGTGLSAPAVTMRALLASHAGSPPDASDEQLLAAVVDRVAAVAGGSVGSVLAKLAASAPSLASLASAAAAAASGAILSTDVARRDELRSFLRWCGFLGAPASAPLSNAPGQPPPSASGTYSPLDTLVAILTAKPAMSYAGGERDMALMRHELEVAFPATGRVERRVGTMIEYADARGRTAMARTVGYTAAAAAQLILDGAAAHCGAGSVPTPRPGATASHFGVLVPTSREWYGPILERLAEEGIAMAETTEVLVQGATLGGATTAA